MFNIIQFLTDNWLPISTTIGTIIMWFSERRRRLLEDKKSFNDATGGMQLMYDKFVEDAGKQYDNLNEKIVSLQENEQKALQERNTIALELSDIKEEVANDKRRILELEAKIREYEIEIEKYKKQIANLKVELNKYQNSK